MTIEPLESRIAPALLLAIETDTNKLVSFDSAAPGTIINEVTVTGLQANELIAAIDSDQSSGSVYGIGLVDDGATRTMTGYRIDPFTGAATKVGSSFSGRADTNTYGFEFNSITLITMNSADETYSFSAGGGAIGTPLNDPNQAESIAAIALDHPLRDAAQTLYGYNFLTDELVRIGDVGGSPQTYSNGVITPIAKVKLNGNTITSNSSQIGFDIGGPYGAPDTAWLSLSRTGLGQHLFTVDLATAALTDLGTIGTGARNFGSLTVFAAAPAPTISANGKTATWTDLDGDAVTLKITQGTLTSANFRMIAGAQGSALSELKLGDSSYTGTNITITAKPGANGGDGMVNIGEIDAQDVNLGAVQIGGDLQHLIAGASTGGVGLKSLKAASFARFGFSLTPDGDFQSRIKSGFGTFTIAGDFYGKLQVNQGNGGTLMIGGNLVGGDLSGSGAVDVGSGVRIGKTVVKGDLIGGAGSYSGTLAYTAKSVTIRGSLIGGDGIGSGSLNVNGGTGGTFTIGGSIVGGDGPNSGSLTLDGISTAKVGGRIEGGGASGSGTIRANSTGALVKSLTIGGDVKSGAVAGGILFERVGTLTIGGSLIGTAAAPVVITASGLAAPTTAAESVAIGRLTIAGDVQHARIAAGLNGFNLAASTVDAAIGTVKIGRNFITSTISAGIDAVNGIFGDANDKFVGGGTGNATIFARIASVTVAGQVIGTTGGAVDVFGIEAEQIGALTIGTTKVPLTAGKDDLTLGFTADVRVREL